MNIAQRDRALPGPAAASLRRMIDGSTAPASIDTLSRMSSGHWQMIAAGSIGEAIDGSSNGYESAPLLKAFFDWVEAILHKLSAGSALAERLQAGPGVRRVGGHLRLSRH